MTAPMELRAAPSRRAFAALVLVTLALLLLALALNGALSLGARAVLLALGAAAGALARRLWQASAAVIVLDGDTLRDDAGHEIARIDQIARVERGAFAFKPSGGFVLHLRETAPRHWAPGLWWRRGRRVGIGGVTAAAPARAMAEAIAARLTAD